MSKSIYEQHDAAFSNVSAYVVLNNEGKRVATVAFKFPRDGAGRLYAYVHWMGLQMVRGWAGGCGYDKRSAAVQSAARRISVGSLTGEAWEKDRDAAHAFVEAASVDDGHHWDDHLRKAGFTVLQAV